MKGAVHCARPSNVVGDFPRAPASQSNARATLTQEEAAILEALQHVL